MQKLMLLDAYALIFRAYYGLIRSPRINSKGENTSAVFGFVNTLEELLRTEQPDFLAVAFDPPGGTFRHEAFADYKAQREETPAGIKWAVPVIKDILEAYGIVACEVKGFEADDVIGTLALQGQAAGLDVLMVTPDSCAPASRCADPRPVKADWRNWMSKPSAKNTDSPTLLKSSICSPSWAMPPTTSRVVPV